ncbi:MAG: VCBS repeat-containing protein [Acidobacteria bacterium]|nr:VCBS repeat-containing protein [Acidobacteriota bacterium]
MRTLMLATIVAGAVQAAPSFRTQEIQDKWGVVYAVLIEDVNKDGKPDVVAINPTQLVWWENPSWKRHVVMDGLTKKDNVCVAAEDIDGDGHLDFALGADWQPSNTKGAGSLQWVNGKGGPVHPLGEEPTLHRMRWGDVDGDGKKELIVVPLHGRDTKGPEWEGNGARILVYWPRPGGEWKMEVADESLHIIHNFIDVNGEIWAASKEGVYAIRRTGANQWSKRKLGEGSPGEIKLGQVNRVRHLATVEPWHGNKIVVYEEPVEDHTPQAGTQVVRKAVPNQQWKRNVIESNLQQAHALGWADFDGDGSDELAVGWRNKPFGVAVYKRMPDGKWDKTMVDDGMATEDLAVGDLNGDGRPEIVGVGRATQNVRIYWNETKPQWTRHVVATGFANSTAIAADFTGDGKPDVITNSGNRTLLYVAPGWKQIVLHEGAGTIHSEALDVDRDGDIDYIGTRYSPGLIFWLEQPKNPLTDKWTYHVIDDVEAGGVDGIHGLILGDVDKDGRLDLIGNSGQPGIGNARPPKFPRNYPNSLAWFRTPRNPRQAKLWERYIFADKDAPGLSHYLGFGDVNGDGRPDIASAAKVADQGNWFAWWEQPRNPRQPWKKHLIASDQEGATNIHIADLNGDRKADFFASRGHGRGIVWYEAPSWTPHEVNASIAGPHSLAIGDIDGDGDTDAVTCAKDSGVAAWFENDGKGNFTTRHIHENQSAYDIRLVDMDRDGDLDVLVAGQASQNVVWFENRLK